MTMAGSFHSADYVIFCLVLIVSLAIGLYHAFTGGKQRTTKEYLMGDRRMKTLPVTLSILVSFVSSILVLGTPAEMYTRGTQLFMRTFGYCIACLLSSLLFVPLFFNLKVTSSFQYLERRFNSQWVKLLGTISMLIGNLFYMGIVIYTPATALQAATGFPLWSSILATGLVTTVYTTLGGLKAVIWTDVFQAAVMLTGIVVILVQGMIMVGGPDKVWKISSQGGRLNFFDFSVDPTHRLSFWSTVIGGTFSSLGIFGIGQTSVQRYCSLPTLQQARRAVYYNIPFLFIMNVLISIVGLVIYAYYADIGCDPLRNNSISSANQLVPYFILNVVNFPGLPGIFLAVLFCGSLSSLSSSLNSAAAVTWQDILLNFGRKFTEFKRTLITKILVIIYGAIAVIIAGLAPFIGGHVLQASLSFSGATLGPSLGMFMLGALFPFANAKGALVGCVLSSLFSLWLAIGAFVIKPHRETLPTSVENCSKSFSNISSILNESYNFTNQSWQDASSWTFDEHGSGYNLTTASSASLFSRDMSDWLFVDNALFKISFLWYCAIGCLLTIILGVVVSLVTGCSNAEWPDQSLYIPIVDRLLSCLPKTVKCQSSLAQSDKRCKKFEQVESENDELSSSQAAVCLNKCSITTHL